MQTKRIVFILALRLLTIEKIYKLDSKENPCNVRVKKKVLIYFLIKKTGHESHGRSIITLSPTRHHVSHRGSTSKDIRQY